jgi:HSP20 family protein
MTRTVRLTRILSMTDQVAAQLHKLHFAVLHQSDASWNPAVNVYDYDDRLEICVDLAGVNKQDIRVDVESRRVTVSGHRTPPATECVGPGCARILAMEIEDGRFERRLELPLPVDTRRVEARHENGWLWIILPKADQGGEA